ncbi:hypothetical protein EYC84_009149 [Monilinia fructicola]|uniref:Uncharacterized protein n=1 Tax=Monilinia fructicola TaxID=38448 RepID=A0A5M9JE28_MONFR|nr:hypothetical protein EYC84_009149 [Monilinia fructicola]
MSLEEITPISHPPHFQIQKYEVYLIPSSIRSHPDRSKPKVKFCHVISESHLLSESHAHYIHDIKIPPHSLAFTPSSQSTKRVKK